LEKYSILRITLSDYLHNIILHILHMSFFLKKSISYLIYSHFSDILLIIEKGGSYLKKVFAIAFLLILLTNSISFADSLNISSESAILIDAETGQVLYEKNPHKKLHPASTTKILTGILTIENANLDDIVTVDEEVVYMTKGAHIALEAGEQLTVKDLLYALLIESANDAALALAKHISGSVEEFAKLMNEKAKELGAVESNFVNPNGLSVENHLTTAYDLSLIAKYAMKNETFREIVSNYTYTIPPTNKKNQERILWSSNKLLYSNDTITVDGKTVRIKYEGITGVKTGYTQEAGNCLVASAQRGNESLIAVALKSNNIYSDIHKLLDYGFDNFEKVNIAPMDQFVDNIKVDNGTIPVVAGILGEELSRTIPVNSFDKISKKVTINDNITAPIEKGDVLGKVEYFLEDKYLGTVNIVSTLDIDEIPSPTFFEKLLSKWYLILLFGFILIRFLIVLNKKNKRRKRRSYYKAHSPYY